MIYEFHLMDPKYSNLPYWDIQPWENTRSWELALDLFRMWVASVSPDANVHVVRFNKDLDSKEFVSEFQKSSLVPEMDLNITFVF